MSSRNAKDMDDENKYSLLHMLLFCAVKCFAESRSFKKKFTLIVGHRKGQPDEIEEK